MNYYVNVARVAGIGGCVVLIGAELVSATIKAKKTGKRVVTVVADDIRNLSRAVQGK